MNYPPHAGHQRAVTARRHAAHEGFACRAAVLDDGTLVGFGYGYTTLPGQWWHDLVRRALDDEQARSGSATRSSCPSCTCCPSSRAAAPARPLLGELAVVLPHDAMLLSTPDVDTRAFRLYRHLGFVDLRRHYLFPGDSRPFAVLGARLPLHVRWRVDRRPDRGSGRSTSSFGAAVLAEVAYPLTSGRLRDAVTVAIVLLVAAPRSACTRCTRGTARGSRPCSRRRPWPAASRSRCSGCTPACRSAATATPAALGAALFGVPLVIAFAWTMLAWPAALAARRLCARLGGPGRRSARGRSPRGTCSSTRRWSTPGTGAGRTRARTCRACRACR